MYSLVVLQGGPKMTESARSVAVGRQWSSTAAPAFPVRTSENGSGWFPELPRE